MTFRGSRDRAISVLERKYPHLIDRIRSDYDSALAHGPSPVRALAIEQKLPIEYAVDLTLAFYNSPRQRLESILKTIGDFLFPDG
jgi:hypothetical protein